MVENEIDDIHLLLASMNEAFYLKDAQSGKIVHISSAFERIWELTRDQIINDPFAFMNSIFEEDLSAVHSRQEEMKNGGRDFDLEYRIVHKDSSILWIHAQTKQIRNLDGTIKYYVAMAEDITERKMREKTILESNARYAALFDNAPDAVVLADLKSGSILEVNAAAERLFLRPRSAFVGLNHTELYPVEAVNENHITFAMRAEPKNMHIPIQRLALRTDGSHVPVEITGSSFDIEGKTYVLGTFRDLSERKKSEALIVQLLAEKQLLLKEVHHRIKNNMSIVSSMLSLQAGMLEDKTATVALDEMSERIAGMMLLYDKLYRSEVFESLSTQKYFPDLLKGIAQNYSASSDASLDWDIAEVSFNSRLLFPLGIIVNELVSNAFKYAFPPHKAGRIFVSLTKENGAEYLLIVTDNGKGYTVPASPNPSSGFGILLVETLVQQINGKIERNSQQGEGTEYRITFPTI